MIVIANRPATALPLHPDPPLRTVKQPPTHILRPDSSRSEYASLHTVYYLGNLSMIVIANRPVLDEPKLVRHCEPSGHRSPPTS
jgi:hypothetical protein